MSIPNIKDADIDANNFGTFLSCSVANNGNKLVFIFANNAIYEVGLSYFLQWFDEPHYFEAGEVVDGKSEITFADTELILSNTAVKVRLNNNAVYVTPWDTVLMACEERYEHFGGLTEKSKNITRKYFKRKLSKKGCS